jgi:hypothetical protein
MHPAVLHTAHAFYVTFVQARVRVLRVYVRVVAGTIGHGLCLANAVERDARSASAVAPSQGMLCM